MLPSISNRIDGLHWGMWHVMVGFQICYMLWFGTLVATGVQFMEDAVPFTCGHTELNNNNWTQKDILNFSTPLDAYGVHDNCLQYKMNYSLFKDIDFKTAIDKRNSNIVEACTKFQFHLANGMRHSVVNQWNLVCTREVQVFNMAAIAYGGFMTGNLLFGYLADRYGRKPLSIILMLCLSIFGIANAVIPNFSLFMAGRFFIGMFNITSVQYVLALEYLNEKQRRYAAGGIWTFYGLGYGFLSVIAWGVRDWRYMQIISSVPCALTLVFFWTLPESPLWLESQGRIDEAHKILDKAYIMNGQAGDLVVEMQANDKNVVEKHAIVDENENKMGLLSLRHHPKLILRTIAVLYVWMAIAIAYYGINLMVSFLGGNIFINNSISGLIEIPGYVLTGILMMLWFRIRSTMICLFASGVSFLLYLSVPNKVSFGPNFC